MTLLAHDIKVHCSGHRLSAVRGNTRVWPGVFGKDVDNSQPTDTSDTWRDHVVRRWKELYRIAEPLDTVRQPIRRQMTLEHHLLTLSHALIGQWLSTSPNHAHVNILRNMGTLVLAIPRKTDIHSIHPFIASLQENIGKLTQKWVRICISLQTGNCASISSPNFLHTSQEP